MGKRPTLVRSIGDTPVQKRGRYLLIHMQSGQDSNLQCTLLTSCNRLHSLAKRYQFRHLTIKMEICIQRMITHTLCFYVIGTPLLQVSLILRLHSWIFPTSQWLLPYYRSQVTAVVRAGLEPDKQPLWTWDQSLITPTRLFKTFKTHLTFEVRKLRLMFFAHAFKDLNLNERI